jgi:hypothetical protein
LSVSSSQFGLGGQAFPVITADDDYREHSVRQPLRDLIPDSVRTPGDERALISEIVLRQKLLEGHVPRNFRKRPMICG